MDGPTLRQMLGTMLEQQLLQDSTVKRSSDYVAKTCLTLIAPQNVQLNIQMPLKHRSQWQTHSGRYLNS